MNSEKCQIFKIATKTTWSPHNEISHFVLQKYFNQLDTISANTQCSYLLV